MDFDVNKRLISLLEAIRYTQTDFAVKIGVKQQQVGFWVKLTEQVPDRQIVRIIQKFPEINANWFIRGEGEMFLNPPFGSANRNPLWQPPISMNDDGMVVRTYSCPDCIWRDRIIETQKTTIAVQNQLVEELQKKIKQVCHENCGGTEKAETDYPERKIQ